MSVIIEGLSAQAMADEPFSFSVRGLTPHAKVTFDIELRELFGRTWGGSFTAVAGGGGALDLEDVPLDGSARPDPTELLWALDPRGTPAVEVTAAAAAHGTVTLREGPRTVAKQDFARVFMSEGVREINLSSPVIGALYLPASPGPHAAVITVSGSGGGIARQEAGLLASRGFACLALAYFNFPGRPSELIDIPLEYFKVALEWLSAQEFVRQDAIAVMGRSRGGELSLQLAATFPAVRAAVAIVPSGYRWGAMTKDGRPGASWTWDSAPLPWVHGRDADWDLAVTVEGAVELTPTFRAAIAGSPPEVLEEARIPVERAHCPILLLCGEADAMWDSVELSDVVMQRATPSAGFIHGVRRIVYPDAGHALGLPYLPAVTSGLHDLTGERFAYGGTRAGTATARVAAWHEILTFLSTTLGRNP